MRSWPWFNVDNWQKLMTESLRNGYKPEAMRIMVMSIMAVTLGPVNLEVSQHSNRRLDKSPLILLIQSQLHIKNVDVFDPGLTKSISLLTISSTSYHWLSHWWVNVVMGQPTDGLTDWGSNWLREQLTEGATDWESNWLMEHPMEQQTDRTTDWWANWLIYQLTDGPTIRPTDCWAI